MKKIVVLVLKNQTDAKAQLVLSIKILKAIFF